MLGEGLPRGRAGGCIAACSTVYTVVRQKRMAGPVLFFARVCLFLYWTRKRELGSKLVEAFSLANTTAGM